MNTRDKVITLAEWLRTLDELLGALRKAQSTDDVRAICVHSRSITELLCQAALDHRNVSPQGTELRALLQTLRSKAFGLVLSDDLDHALNTLQAEGNFGAHPKTSDPDRMQQASRRVVEELPKVLRWFHSTIAEREPSQLVSEFLADPFKRAATASPGATRLDDLQQPIVISQGDTRVPVARNAVIATLFALVTVLSSGRLQGWFSRTLRNSHIPHRTTQSDGGCVVPAVVEVHLRPSPTCYSIGKLYPGSELVNVLEMSPLTRWGRNLCRVRTTSDQREGWFFVHRAELELACPGRWPRTSTSDVDCRLPPLNNGLCEDSMAFVNGVCVDRTLVTVNEYQSCVDVGECSVRVTTALQTRNLHGVCANASNPAHPINCVTHEQAEAFCHWVGGRLPNASEWTAGVRQDRSGADGGQAVLDMTNRMDEWTRDTVSATAGTFDAGPPRHLVLGPQWTGSNPSQITDAAPRSISDGLADTTIGFRCVSRSGTPPVGDGRNSSR